MYLQHPIPPDSIVLNYARYSTEEQRQQTIDDQHQYCDGFLQEQGSSHSSELIADEGVSGELRSRPGIDLVRNRIQSRAVTLIICEDSSRLFRGVGPCLELVGQAVDHDIRVICINDGVDTANEDWQNRLEDAQRTHGQNNYFGRFRIKRSLENRWRCGAAVSHLRPGYIRELQNPRDLKSLKFDKVDPRWVEIIRRAFQMIANGSSLHEVADYLTGEGLPKAANSLKPGWSVDNVAALIRSPIYRGKEIYRRKVAKKHYGTGKSKLVPNPRPEKILTRESPDLRIVDDWLWQEANSAIENRRTRSQSASGTNHPLHGIPRDSRGPLSGIFVCGICGQKMIMAGRNEGGYRCRAAGKGACWNKTTALRDLTHRQIGQAVSAAILAVCPEVTAALVQYVQEQFASDEPVRAALQEVSRRLETVQRKQQRLVRHLAKFDEPPDAVVREITDLSGEESSLRQEQQQLEAQTSVVAEVPSDESVRAMLNDAAQRLATLDRETGPLLRRLLKGPIVAIPHQQFDSDKVVLRAEFSLRLVGILPEELRLLLKHREVVSTTTPVLIERKICLDLFEPSQAPKHALRAIEIYEAAGQSPPTLEELGRRLNTSKRSAHLALQMGRKLREAGLTDPFIRLTERPASPSRWRSKKRHPAGTDAPEHRRAS